MYLKQGSLLVCQGAEGGQHCGCGSRLPLRSRWLAASQSLGTSFSSSVVVLPARGHGEVSHVPHTSWHLRLWRREGRWRAAAWLKEKIKPEEQTPFLWVSHQMVMLHGTGRAQGTWAAKALQLLQSSNFALTEGKAVLCKSSWEDAHWLRSICDGDVLVPGTKDSRYYWTVMWIKWYSFLFLEKLAN